jgi:hypothetical protein
LLADQHGVLHLIAATSERTHHLEVFERQRDEGPCLDCYQSGAPVIVPRPRRLGAALAAILPGRSIRWVRVRARPSDEAAGHRARSPRLFGDHPGPLDLDDLALPQALVHVASVAIVNENAAADRDTINDQRTWTRRSPCCADTPATTATSSPTSRAASSNVSCAVKR